MKKQIIMTALAGVLCLGSLSQPAMAGFNISIDIGAAPPPPRVEVVHEVRRGMIWTPGYWAWDGHRHHWVEGRYVEARPGYRYCPARWVDHDGRHRFEPARWEREHHAERFDRGRHNGWHKHADRDDRDVRSGRHDDVGRDGRSDHGHR